MDDDSVQGGNLRRDWPDQSSTSTPSHPRRLLCHRGLRNNNCHSEVSLAVGRMPPKVHTSPGDVRNHL